MSSSSENPVQNKVVKEAIDTVSEFASESIESHDVQIALLASGFNELEWTYHSLGFYTSEYITPTRDTAVTIHINSGYSVLVTPDGDLAPYYATSDSPVTLSADASYVFQLEPSDTSVNLATILRNVYVTNCVNQLVEKQDVLTFDSAPTSLSLNPVTSGGIYSALLGKQDAMTYTTSTATSYTLVENEFVDFGEQTTLTITCSTSGLYSFAFTSGTTATTLTLDGITMPDDFTVEASKRYEINILNGYGVAQSWTVS